MKEPFSRGDRGPGVPEAVPRGVQRLAAELGVETLDRIWVFPPMISGRKESGLLAVSRFMEAGDPERRILTVLPYSAERTGKGLVLESSLEEHGEAPVDRLPRVMEGVVKRAESDLGEPREVEIGGSEESFLAFLADFDRTLLDPDLPPLATVVEEVPEVPVPPVEDEEPRDAGSSAAAATDEDPFDLYAPGPTP